MVLLRTNYKIVIALILALCGFYLIGKEAVYDIWSNTSCAIFLDFEKQIDDIEQLYGIELEYKLEKTIIPELWVNPPASGTVEAIAQSDLCRAVSILSRELKKYPSEVIRSNLKSIYLLKSLSFYGVEYGGTFLGRSVYLTAGNRSEGYSEYYFSSLIHHELSSLLFNSYAFPEEEWSAINPKDFHYAQSDQDILNAIETNTDLEGSDKLYHNGFIADYGQSTLENDFNLYAELVFVDPKKLQTLAKKYPIIKKKAELVKKFYMNISGDFHLEF